MNLSKQLIFESVQILRNGITETNDYRIVLAGNPIQYESIKDDIEWEDTDNIDGVDLTYRCGNMKLPDDSIIKVIATTKLDSNLQPSLMVIPLNENVHFTYYPYTLSVRNPRIELPKIIEFERHYTELLKGVKDGEISL